MSKEEIDKWLDNEYGVSYTRLEELHDFLIEQNMKYQDKIDILQQENKQLKEQLENKIDLYEDTISYQLGFDKGKEYLQQRIDKAYNSLGILLQILEEQSGDKDIKWILERLNPIQEILGDKQ